MLTPQASLRRSDAQLTNWNPQSFDKIEMSTRAIQAALRINDQPDVNEYLMLNPTTWLCRGCLGS